MLSILTRISSLGSVVSARVLQRPAVVGKGTQPVTAGLAALGFIAVLGSIIAGCGSGSISAVKAGPISVESASGAIAQISSLSVSSTALLSMMPIGDSTNAGVDWVVICGGNPVTGSISNGACGTLSPTHTADGAATLFTAPSVIPIGTTVTITASVTSNPSQSSSVKLSLLPLPITVSLASPFPSSVEVSGTASPGALVTNDTTGGGGVMWAVACGSSACGSFNPTVTTTLTSNTTTYTAPAAVPPGGTVTITATSVTDPTKSASAMVTITPPPGGGGPLSVSVLPASVSVTVTPGTAHTTQVTALVANDLAVAGVDWSVSCAASSCGSFTAHTASGIPMTYVGPTAVPPGGAVTLTATSTTDPTKSASAIATVVTTTVITLTPTGLPASLQAGAQAMLSATVVGDSSNSGVNWVASCGTAGGCGTFSLSPAHTASGGKIIYTAPSAVPAGNVVTIAALSAASAPSNVAIEVTTIMPPTPPTLTIAFAQSPPTVLLGGAQAPVTAVVTNDVAPGGVTWTAQCSGGMAGACGTIAPYQTASGGVAVYTAPPVTSAGTVVTINASSISNPKVSVSSSPIAINPSTGSLSINFVPSAPSQVQADATISLAAAVANDATNAGVDWQVCASGCGFFTTQAAISSIPATTTTPFVPAVPAVTATTVPAWPNNLPLAYTAPSQPPSSGSVAVEIAAHASPTTANSATIAITSAASGPVLYGVVQAGMQPVVGAAVGLYAAGTSGYASAASQIFAPGGSATVTTDKNGNFTVPAGYTCPQPNSQMYLMALGGQVGTNAANPNLSLMTAVGSCSSLGSSSVVVNEVTSIASAWATAAFASNDALTGNSSFLYLGTSIGNLTGLANAFAAVNNLVDISTGLARVTVPEGNGLVPYPEINTLADFLNACAATSGGMEGDGSVCGTLFTETDVLGTGSFNGSIAPSDTLQAAFNIAQHPISNYGYVLDRNKTLMGLATPAAPFQPILTAQPNDWSISVNYTGGGGLSPASSVGSFAVDSVGDLWLTDNKAGSVIEWNAVGAAISPSAGFPAGGGPIAIDAMGNVWISGNGVLTELTGIGIPVPGSPFGGVAGGGSDIALDAQSNLWITNPGGVNEFNSLGLEISPSAGFTNDGIVGITAVGIDSSNNVWVGNTTSTPTLNFAELTNPGGQLIVNTAGVPSSGQVQPGMVADSAGDIWTVAGPDLFMVPPFGGKGSIPVPTIYGPGAAPQSQNASISNPGSVALDGAGTVWVASPGGGPASTIPSNVGVAPIAPSLFESSGGGALLSESLATAALRAAVDGSGNVWVLLSNNTVTEFVGVATPVVTPIALAVKNKKLGAKP
jgi:hypothetical protein